MSNTDLGCQRSVMDGSPAYVGHLWKITRRGTLLVYQCQRPGCGIYEGQGYHVVVPRKTPRHLQISSRG